MIRHAVLFGLLFGVAIGSPALAESSGRVEVVEVKGIIDSSVERTVVATIKRAEREQSLLVVLQIDSVGVVDRARASRLVRTLRADVPVVAWVGPPGARARNGAVLLLNAAFVAATSPLSEIGPVRTLDLRVRESRCSGGLSCRRPSKLISAASVSELLEELDGRTIDADGRKVRLATDLSAAGIRYHRVDLLGRLLHAAAQPSMTYLLLLLALVGIVFELFHPSTGPAGIAGLAALALALYGIVTLGASWLGFALIVAGIAGFAVDLRYQSLGPPTAAGFAGLVAGSLLLFRGPWLRVSPWVLAIGITGMVLFLLGAMTRVLRDLRAVAHGDLQVRDAHHHGDD